MKLMHVTRIATPPLVSNKAEDRIMMKLTCDDLGPLKILIWVNVAWGEGKVESDGKQDKVRPSPHAMKSSARHAL